MKKFYLILKILLILAALIALGYLVTSPDSEVILKRPWLDKTSDVDYGVPGPIFALQNQINTLTKQAETALPSSTPTPAEQNGITDWKTYRNEKYWFEVKYPQDKLYVAFENADEYILILSRFKIYVPDFTIQESFLSEEDNCLWPKKCFAGWQDQEIYTYMKNIESNKKYELSCTDTVDIIQGGLCDKIFSTFKFIK